MQSAELEFQYLDTNKDGIIDEQEFQQQRQFSTVSNTWHHDTHRSLHDKAESASATADMKSALLESKEIECQRLRRRAEAAEAALTEARQAVPRLTAENAQLIAERDRLAAELAKIYGERTALLEGVSDLRDTLARERGDMEYKTVEFGEVKGKLLDETQQYFSSLEAAKEMIKALKKDLEESERGFQQRLQQAEQRWEAESLRGLREMLLTRQFLEEKHVSMGQTPEDLRAMMDAELQRREEAEETLRARLMQLHSQMHEALFKRAAKRLRNGPLS